MPPHLHPRSRMTSSLFATTVAASFLVVTLPHVLPCPVPPRVAYADAVAAAEGGDGTIVVVNRNGHRVRKRRRQRRDSGAAAGGGSAVDSIVQFPGGSELQNRTPPPARRECPVPKPGGVIGKLLGFKTKEEKQKRPAEEVEITVATKEDGRTGSATKG